MPDFLIMDEYAAFIWLGWGVSAAALGLMAALVVIERRRALTRLTKAQERGGAA